MYEVQYTQEKCPICLGAGVRRGGRSCVLCEGKGYVRKEVAPSRKQSFQSSKAITPGNPQGKRAGGRRGSLVQKMRALPQLLPTKYRDGKQPPAKKEEGPTEEKKVDPLHEKRTEYYRDGLPGNEFDLEYLKTLFQDMQIESYEITAPLKETTAFGLVKYKNPGQWDQSKLNSFNGVTNVLKDLYTEPACDSLPPEYHDTFELRKKKKKTSEWKKGPSRTEDDEDAMQASGAESPERKVKPSVLLSPREAMLQREMDMHKRKVQWLAVSQLLTYLNNFVVRSGLWWGFRKWDKACGPAKKKGELILHRVLKAWFYFGATRCFRQWADYVDYKRTKRVIAAEAEAMMEEIENQKVAEIEKSVEEDVDGEIKESQEASGELGHESSGNGNDEEAQTVEEKSVNSIGESAASPRKKKSENAVTSEEAKIAKGISKAINEKLLPSETGQKKKWKKAQFEELTEFGLMQATDRLTDDISGRFFTQGGLSSRAKETIKETVTFFTDSAEVISRSPIKKGKKGGRRASVSKMHGGGTDRSASPGGKSNRSHRSNSEMSSRRPTRTVKEYIDSFEGMQSPATPKLKESPRETKSQGHNTSMENMKDEPDLRPVSCPPDAMQAHSTNDANVVKSDAQPPAGEDIKPSDDNTGQNMLEEVSQEKSENDSTGGSGGANELQDDGDDNEYGEDNEFEDDEDSEMGFEAFNVEIDRKGTSGRASPSHPAENSSELNTASGPVTRDSAKSPSRGNSPSPDGFNSERASPQMDQSQLAPDSITEYGELSQGVSASENYASEGRAKSRGEADELQPLKTTKKQAFMVNRVMNCVFDYDEDKDVLYQRFMKDHGKHVTFSRVGFTPEDEVMDQRNRIERTIQEYRKNMWEERPWANKVEKKIKGEVKKKFRKSKSDLEKRGGSEGENYPYQRTTATGIAPPRDKTFKPE